MARGLLLAALLALGGTVAAQAADAPAAVEHQRGEFRFSVAPAPAFVVEADVPEAWDPKVGASDDRWRNWLLDRQVDRRTDTPVDYYDHVYEPMSPSQVAEAAKFQVDFNPGYQTLTLHRVQLRRDGQWLDRLDPARISLARRETGFEDDMADGSVTALVVLPDVRPHDVVRIAYSIRGGNPILAGHVANIFPIAWVDPILDRRGRALYAPGARLGIHRHDTSVEVTQRALADGTEAAFHLHGVAAVRDPGGTPVWYSPYPFVEIGPETRWADIVAWALPLYPADATLPPELEARVAQWRQLPDRGQQVMAVLQAMQEEVRYFGVEMGDNTHRPAPPAETWTRRFGDCKDKAWLMVAVLRALGLEAEPALVSTDVGRSVRDLLPAASAFDHVIVRLRMGGKSYWLDPTLTQQRGTLDKLDVADYGAALPIAAGVDRVVPVVAPGTPDNAIDVVERFVPDADGKAIELFVETRYAGQRAEIMRRRLRAQRLQDVAASFEDYYRKSYGALGVVSPTTASEDDAANTVLVREHYRLTPGWDHAGLTTRRLGAYADGLRADVVVPDTVVRTAPIDLANPTHLSHEIRIELPPGWSLDDAPESIALEAPPVEYRRTLSSTGNKVSLLHRFDVRKTDVEADEVEDYLARVREIGNALDRHVNLRLPAEAGRSERDRRLQDLLRDVMSKETK
jgi:hypothetical protein